jgi:predicted dehydrogenase
LVRPKPDRALAPFDLERQRLQHALGFKDYLGANPVPWQQANQMDEDARSIMDNRKMAVPGEEGLNDIRVIEAIYASVEQQKEIKVFS